MKVDTFTLVDLALTLERQVQAVLGEQDMGSSFGPARPRAIVCEGAGGWVMQARETSFSRTCWILQWCLARGGVADRNS